MEMWIEIKYFPNFVWQNYDEVKASHWLNDGSFQWKKMKLPERIIHFNIVIGSVQVTSIAAQVQRTYHLKSLLKELPRHNKHTLLKTNTEGLTENNHLCFWHKTETLKYISELNLSDWD